MYDFIEAHMKYKNDHLKNIKEEYENIIDDYRTITEEKTEKCINEKLEELPIHQLLQKLGSNDLFWDFDAVSLYPFAMSIEKKNYPKIETGYAFTKDVNDEIVEKFNNQTFKQASAFSKIKYYNPKILGVQHITVKGKVNKNEVNRMCNGYFVDTLISVDIQEIVKIGRKEVEIYEQRCCLT